jgi:GntR family transcriptional regulator
MNSPPSHEWSPKRISFSRSDGTPKYIAIARAIASGITEGELASGESLPSQKDLAEVFGVTVMTVRQAVQRLTEQGLLSTAQGKGTYVTRPPYRLALGPLSSFAAQIAASGRTLRTEILGYAPVEVSPFEQKRMGLFTSHAFELVRLRYVDDLPVILQTSLLAVDIAQSIEIETLTTRSLYAVLHDDLGIQIERATETVQAVSLDAESAGLLARPLGEPALLSARLTFNNSDVAVLDDRALTAGDSVVISTERRADEQSMGLMLSSDALLPGRPPVRHDR